MNIDIKQKKKKEYTLKIKLDEDEIKNLSRIGLSVKSNVYRRGWKFTPFLTGYDTHLNIENFEQAEFLCLILREIQELNNEN